MKSFALILYVLFYWLLLCFAGFLVSIRATKVPNFSQISELLRVKVLDIPHQLWTAYLSQIGPSPIGMKSVPDERLGTMSHWGNCSKILRASFLSSRRWKLTFTNVWSPITIFLKNIINCKYGPKVSLGTISNPIGESHLLSFQSLCSSDDVYRPISSPYISTCTACSALLFGPNMYLPNTNKPYKKRTFLMRINRVITVFPISRDSFHRVQCKIDYPFSPGRLARFLWRAFLYVGIDDLRMRMYLQHRRCFRLPVKGKNDLFMKCFAARIGPIPLTFLYVSRH